MESNIIKQALEEANGDKEKAKQILKEKVAEAMSDRLLQMAIEDAEKESNNGNE